MCRIRDGVKAELRNLHTARLALAIGAIVDPLNRRINLVEGVLLAPHQAQGEFLIGIVAASSAMLVGILVVLLWSLFKALSSIWVMSPRSLARKAKSRSR